MVIIGGRQVGYHCELGLYVMVEWSRSVGFLCRAGLPIFQEEQIRRSARCDSGWFEACLGSWRFPMIKLKRAGLGQANPRLAGVAGTITKDWGLRGCGVDDNLVSSVTAKPSDIL